MRRPKEPPGQRPADRPRQPAIETDQAVNSDFINSFSTGIIICMGARGTMMNQRRRTHYSIERGGYRAGTGGRAPSGNVGRNVEGKPADRKSTRLNSSH